MVLDPSCPYEAAASTGQITVQYSTAGSKCTTFSSRFFGKKERGQKSISHRVELIKQRIDPGIADVGIQFVDLELQTHHVAALRPRQLLD